MAQKQLLNPITGQWDLVQDLSNLGDATFNGNVTINGALFGNGNGTFTGTVSAAALKAGTGTFSSTVTVAALKAGTGSFSGGVTINGLLSPIAGLTTTGGVICGSVEAGYLFSTGALDVNGAIDCLGSLIQEGQATFYKSVTVYGALYGNGNATFANNVSAASVSTALITHTDDLTINLADNKTVVLEEVVYDDIRVVPGSFDRPGVSDPAIVAYAVGGGGVSSYLWEFKKNDIASFTVQIPHSYKTGEDIKVHIHWTPGTRGNEENGATVGWKVDYSWANINGAFGAMATADLSDACDGTDHKHQMTPEVTITGTDKGISSMLICNVKRTDTGTDDTWSGTASGQLPMLLEIDFHFPIDTLGSRDWGAK